MTPRILLLGSYNGQDSLGDECLFKAVVTRFCNTFAESPQIVLHAHYPTALLDQMEADGLCASNWGIQSLFWIWRQKLRHTRLPWIGYATLAVLTFPLLLLYGLVAPRSKSGRALRQIAGADIVYIFGGTNSSVPWFWTNMPYYMLTTALARLCGAKVYLGPQQYGPMSRFEAWLYRSWIKTCVNDFRARNPKCLELLGVPESKRPAKLLWDEVYSNVALYPPRTANGGGEYLLVNLRGHDFSDTQSFESDDVGQFAKVLSGVNGRLGLPFVFFGVSREGMSNDERTFGRLRDVLPESIGLRSAGRCDSERDLMALASKAKGCISMSFHGCLISGLTGIGYVPVTSGRYYDHKYIGFSRYGDGARNEPIRLSVSEPSQQADRIVERLSGYDSQRAAEIREEANRVLQAFYDQIADDIGAPKRQ